MQNAILEAAEIQTGGTVSKRGAAPALIAKHCNK